MFGQATERSPSRSAGLAAVCAAATLLAGVFLLAGPTAKAQAIIWENDKITVDTDHPGFLVTLKQEETALVLAMWRGPWCDQDVTGDGTRGSEGDRAMCVLDNFRALCPTGWWPPQDMVGGYLCRHATERGEWDDIRGALSEVLNAGYECLSVHIRPGSDNWTKRDISEDECAA
jgi:hypothetical protein